MPALSTLATGLVAAFITAYGCVSSCRVLFSGDDDDGRPPVAPPLGNGTITTEPTYRPFPSSQPPHSYGRRTETTVKTPALSGHDGDLSRSSRILPHANRSHLGPSRPSTALISSSSGHPQARYGVITTQPANKPPPAPSNPQTSYASKFKTSIARDNDRNVSHSGNTLPYTGQTPPVPQFVAVASSSSRDPQALSLPRAPLAPLNGLPKPESDEGENAKRAITASGLLRERAQHRKRMMEKAAKLAKAARKKGDSHAAAKHDREARENKAAKDFLNKEAAKITFQEKNKDCTEGMIDLHGLTVAEALKYAEQELQSAARRTNKVVRFIVGQGLHSVDGKAKIRPAVERLCKQYFRRGLQCSLNPSNPGVLIVQC
ncbi:hypothetical protein BC826DRAFT_998114 [Russula brevipes]|nr:hypothetical protein BC826DRAFT_998114 [Russula brevipes]